MKLSCNITGLELSRRLAIVGYQISRQSGSHIRLTTHQQGEHHLTVPQHNPLKVKTLSAVLKDVGEHFSLNQDELIKFLFD